MKRQIRSGGSASVSRRGRNAGFTMIELLVAMFILVVIVLIVTLIFRRATTAWDSGMNKAQLDMTGRGVADYVAQDLAMAVETAAYPFSASGAAADFWVLGEASGTAGALTRVQYVYNNGMLSRKGDGSTNYTVLVEGLKGFAFSSVPSSAIGLPSYVDVNVAVTNEAGIQNLYQSRAFFLNRNRYKL